MIRASLATLLSLLLCACFWQTPSIYDLRMEAKPWEVLKAHQDEVEKLSPGEQKLIAAVVARLEIKHSVTGYLEPDLTFGEMLRRDYGPQLQAAIDAQKKADNDAELAREAR